MTKAVKNKTQRKSSEDQPAICSMCGEKTARAITRPHVFGRGADLLIIENVPMMTCGNCGETYLTGDILKILEDILKNQASHVTRRMVRVAEFV